ncbi:MAG: helix-turn-helix domain-containing protein [Bacteroidota bacterium]
MSKSKVKTIREKMGFTQADLAEQSNLSVRTIQRLESGNSIPKGYTLKVLAEALNVEPVELQAQEEEQAVEVSNNHEDAKIRLLNLSALCFIGIPFGNILIPFLIWNRHKALPLVDEIGRKVINFQIIWTLCTAALLIVSPFLQKFFPFNTSLMLVLGLGAVLVNLFFIFRSARALLRQDYDILPSMIRIF